MLIPAGYCLAKYRCTLTGDSEEMIFTMGHEALTFSDVALANALMDAYDDTVWSALGVAGYILKGVDVEVGSLTSGESPYFSYRSTRSQNSGSRGTEGTQSNTSPLIHKVTAAPGRRGRGRAYPPGLLVDSEINAVGAVSSGTFTTMQAAWVAFLARLNSDGLTPFLLHDSPPATPNEITALTLDGTVATQRRRMRR